MMINMLISVTTKSLWKTMMMICPIYILVNIALRHPLPKYIRCLDFRRLRASDLKSQATTDEANDENTTGKKRKAQTSQVNRALVGE